MSKNGTPIRETHKAGKTVPGLGTQPSDRSENDDILRQAMEAAYADRGPDWADQFKKADTAGRIELLRGSKAIDPSAKKILSALDAWDAIYGKKEGAP